MALGIRQAKLKESLLEKWQGSEVEREKKSSVDYRRIWALIEETEKSRR